MVACMSSAAAAASSSSAPRLARSSRLSCGTMRSDMDSPVHVSPSLRQLDGMQSHMESMSRLFSSARPQRSSLSSSSSSRISGSDVFPSISARPSRLVLASERQLKGASSVPRRPLLTKATPVAPFTPAGGITGIWFMLACIIRGKPQN